MQNNSLQIEITVANPFCMTLLFQKEHQSRLLIIRLSTLGIAKVLLDGVVGRRELMFDHPQRYGEFRDQELLVIASRLDDLAPETSEALIKELKHRGLNPDCMRNSQKPHQTESPETKDRRSGF